MSLELESLDDIIKKKKIANPLFKKQGMKKKPGGLANKPVGLANKGPRTVPGVQNAGIRRPVKTNGVISRTGPRRVVEDARTRIIQKTKQRIRDAREKLGNTRMGGDARNKLRTNSMGNFSGRLGARDVVSSSQGRRTTRPLSRTIGTINNRTTNFRAVIPRETRYMDPQILGGYVNNYGSSQGSLRRSVINDSYGNSGYQAPQPLFGVKTSPYFDWDNPANAPRGSSRLSELERSRDYKVLSSSAMSKMDPYRGDYYDSKPVRSFLSEDYYTVKTGLSSRSRLESPPKPRQSIHASSRLKPSSSPSSQGYRIVVSNLQANVTQEDIKELFEDIGELVVSRLVRPGIAEVVYKSLKDATKAVETYHNRQLDGHPMKCLLVNPKTKSSSSSTRSVLAGTRSNYQPSLSTVHRALFD